MEFQTHFADGDVQWIPYDANLFKTIPYETFCRKVPELFLLLFPSAEEKRRIRTINASPITLVKPGDTVWVSLRSYNDLWYRSLPLADLFHKEYVVKYVYRRLLFRNRIEGHCPVFDEVYPLDNLFVHQYGSRTVFDPVNMVKIDEAFCLAFPSILPDRKRNALLQRFRRIVFFSNLFSSYPAQLNNYIPNGGGVLVRQ